MERGAWSVELVRARRDRDLSQAHTMDEHDGAPLAACVERTRLRRLANRIVHHRPLHLLKVQLKKIVRARLRGTMEGGGAKSVVTCELAFCSVALAVVEHGTWLGGGSRRQVRRWTHLALDAAEYEHAALEQLGAVSLPSGRWGLGVHGSPIRERER